MESHEAGECGADWSKSKTGGKTGPKASKTWIGLEFSGESIFGRYYPMVRPTRAMDFLVVTRLRISWPPVCVQVTVTVTLVECATRGRE